LSENPFGKVSGEQINPSVIGEELDSFFYSRLFRWLLRWSIGFGIIALVTDAYPNVFWLWYVGLGFALISLGFLVIVHFFLKRMTKEIVVEIGEIGEMADWDELSEEWKNAHMNKNGEIGDIIDHQEILERLRRKKETPKNNEE